MWVQPLRTKGPFGSLIQPFRGATWYTGRLASTLVVMKPRGIGGGGAASLGLPSRDCQRYSALEPILQPGQADVPCRGRL